MDDDKKDTEMRNFFKVHLQFLKLMGVPIEPFSPNTNIILKFLFISYATAFLMTFVFLFTLGEFIETFYSTDSIDKLTFNLCYLFTHILGSVKIATVIFKRNKIWNLCKILGTDLKPNQLRGGQAESMIMKHCVKATHIQSLFFHVGVVFVILNRLVFILLEQKDYFELKALNLTSEAENVPLPFLTYIPFEYDTSPYCEIATAYHILCGWLFGFYIGEIDAVLTGFLIHIKGQFAILNNSLKINTKKITLRSPDLKPRINNDPKTAELNKNVYMISQSKQEEAQEFFKSCIAHHHRILEFCEIVEKDFNFLMLLQFLASLLMVCCQLFQLSLSDPLSFRGASMLCYMVLMLFQLLSYCWHGNEVILNSSSLCNTIFQSNWIVLNEPTKKYLVLMMLRAQRPIKLTAGKFSVLSIQTFMSIIRGSASYFMVLRQTQH